MEALALVDSIPGWMLPEDAEKLYELAHSSSGPILEVGTYHGKSAVLMALAIRDAQRNTPVYTVDVDPSSIKAATAEAQARGLAGIIVFVRGTLCAFARAYPRLRPAVTFIDGDHSKAGVERDLVVLEKLVPLNGALVFHDFNDPQNDDAACDAVKVRATVEASWVARECDFEGLFGACGLFTRRTAPAPSDVTTVDLRRLDDIKDQYLHGLRYPLGRLFRRIHPRR